MIPSNIDCLIPVERRVLVIMNRFGSAHPVKSFKIDGCIVGINIDQIYAFDRNIYHKFNNQYFYK